MDTETIVDLGNNVFIVLVLLVSAGITSHFIYGYGTRKAKDAFVLLVLLLIVGTQLFYLINAATYVPATRFYIFNVMHTIKRLMKFFDMSFFRKSCIELTVSTVEKVERGQ